MTKKTRHELHTLLLALGAASLMISCGGGGSNGDAGDIRGDPDITEGADTSDIPADGDASDIPSDRDAADGENPDAAHEPSDAVDATEAADTADTQEEDGASAYEGVQCGSSVCLEPQVCCWHFGTPPNGTCTTEAECIACSSCFTTQKCDGPEDCEGGEICCHIGASVTEVIECGSGPECYRVCHTEADCNEAELCCGTLTNEGLLVSRCYEGTICPP